MNMPEKLRKLITVKNGRVTLNQTPTPLEREDLIKCLTAYDEMIWSPEYHLNHISDAQLNLAFMLIKKRIVTNVYKNISDSGEFVFTVTFNLKNSCYPDIYNDINSLEPSEKEYVLNCSATSPIRTCIGDNCNEMRCPIRLAGYLLYLTVNNQLDDILKERALFRERPDFKDTTLMCKWNPPDGLKNIPEKDYQLGKALADGGYIILRPYPDEKGNLFFDYHPVSDCANEKAEERRSCNQSILCAITNNHDTITDREEWINIFSRRAIGRKMDLCKNCQAALCPYVIGAYIRYLQLTGQQDVIDADRAYYAEHPENINYGSSAFKWSPDPRMIEAIKQYLKSVSDEILDTARWLIDTNRLSLMQEVTEQEQGNRRKISRVMAMSFSYDDALTATDLPAFKAIAEQIEPKPFLAVAGFVPVDDAPIGIRVMYLACCLDYLDRMKINYSSIIEERNRVMTDFIERASEIDHLDHILNLAKNSSSNSLYCVVQGNRNSGKREVIKQIASILAKHGKINTAEYTRITMQQASELLTSHKRSQEEYDSLSTGFEFSTFETNKLYVLTGLKRYLKEYPYYKDMLGAEVRNNAYVHLAKILGRFFPDTYIIICGEPGDVKEFLNLDNKYRFLFGSNIIDMPDLTTHEMYERYVGALSEDIKAQIKDEDAFEDTFTEYITFNEKFLPFGNSELAAYLANYSNIEGRPVLPPSVYDDRKTRQQFEDIVGMDSIKQQVKDFESYIAFRKRAQAAGLNIGENNMHMQFVGNPGTGKTTIARIIAAMLFDIGVLKEDKLIEVERKDLVAQYVGQTATKTADKIKEAMGGVLFIDEAYSLVESDDDPFGKEAVSTLIKAMEDHRDDLIVIFAGYDREMHEFITSNPGIASRIGYTFTFPDYTCDELAEMFRRSMTKQGFMLSDGVVDEVRDICDYYSKRKNFGNGRFVKKIEQQTIINHSKNSEKEGYSISSITMDDMPGIPDFAPKTQNNDGSQITIDRIVGMKDVKEQLGKFKSRISFEQKAKSLGINIPSSNHHMLFMGNPGTGKTTVARIIAKELYDAGIIRENRLTEVSPNDLVAKYVGQTGPKTQDMIDMAMGGVLFIDEAYQLTGDGEHSFGAEAISTLIKAMEDHRDDFVVIFAGYEDSMKTFLEANAGLASRIGYTFHFEDYNAEELTEIFVGKITDTGLKCEDEAVKKKVTDVIQYFTSVPNFGNGRFAERVSQIVFELHAENCKDTTDVERIKNITLDDIPDVETIIDHMPDGENMIHPGDIQESQNIRTAVHELGHALICKLYFPDHPIERITIAAEGNGALGYVQHKNPYVGNSTATELKHRICVSMAGIASEKVFLGEYGNGGTSDLENATNLAVRMITQFGMSKNGFFYESKPDAESVKEEANALLSDEFNEAKNLVSAHREELTKARDYLLEKRTITDAEFSGFIGMEPAKIDKK